MEQTVVNGVKTVAKIVVSLEFTWGTAVFIPQFVLFLIRDWFYFSGPDPIRIAKQILVKLERDMSDVITLDLVLQTLICKTTREASEETKNARVQIDSDKLST